MLANTATRTACSALASSGGRATVPKTSAVRFLVGSRIVPFFYPNGNSISRLLVGRDTQGRIIALVFHDDRHDERWEKRVSTAAR